MSSTHIAITTEGGQVYVAGPNSNGQLSLGTLTQTNTFSFAKLDATTNLTSVLQAVDGSAHSLFLRSIGNVYASGLNSNGQLGLGTTVDMSFAALVQQSAGVDLSNVASVAAGGAHSIFLLSSGTALSCGLNVNGQLGDGTTTQRTYPVAMNTAVSTPITSVGFIAAGDYHSLVVKTDGTVFGAGLNADGQLGLGTTVNGSYLQQMKTGAAVNLVGVSQVACGGRHSLALTSAGTVYGCGANAGGQLALGTTTGATYAGLCLSAAATTLTGIVQVAAGATHSLFLKSDGTVLACGSNTVGQLGDGTLVNKSYPVAVLTSASVPLTGISAIHATANQSYFLSRDGYIYACGFGGTGAFGVGTTTNSSYAVVVITPTATTWKNMGYSANYARKKGATVANLVTAGFSTLEIVCAGYSKAELVAGGLSVAAMRNAGATYKQLAFAGYTDAELVAAGYTSPIIVVSSIDNNVFLSGLPLLSIAPPPPTLSIADASVTTGFTTTKGNSYIAFDVSFTKAVLSRFGGIGNLSYATNTGSGWSSFSDISTNQIQYTQIALTDDGNLGVVATGLYAGGLVYKFTWNSGTSKYSGLTGTAGSVVRRYSGVALTPTGSRLVACVNANDVVNSGYIYVATWNSGTSNFDAFIQTLEPTSRNYFGITISRDGSKIAYNAIGATYNTYVSVWNNSNYSVGTAIGQTKNGRSVGFADGTNTIWSGTAADASGSLWYSTWNSSTSSYSNFTPISTTKIPGGLNAFGLWVHPSSKILYFTPYDTLDQPSTIYRIDIPYTLTPSYTITAGVNDNVVYVSNLLMSNTTTISNQTGSFTYRNGTYTISASSYNSGAYVPSNTFRLSTASEWRTSSNLYDIASGAYLGSTATTNIANSSDMSGEWIQIQLPYYILLRSVGIRELEQGHGPKSFAILGSNEGTYWNILYDTTQSIVFTSNTLFTIQLINQNTSTTPYKYLRFVIRSTAGGGSSTVATLNQLNYIGDIYL